MVELMLVTITLVGWIVLSAAWSVVKHNRQVRQRDLTFEDTPKRQPSAELDYIRRQY